MRGAKYLNETGFISDEHAKRPSQQIKRHERSDRERVERQRESNGVPCCRGLFLAYHDGRTVVFGLPVAPFDLQATRILAEPSNDIDTVLDLFSRNKGAYVGYSTCEAPFYLLLTDCVRSMRHLVPADRRLSGVKKLFARSNKPLPPDPGESFVHGSAIIARQPGDTISTVALIDPHPTGGISHALCRLAGKR